MKIYKVTMTKDISDRKYITTGTLEQLITYFGYTLDKGESWQHEKGNKKINLNPKSIKSLMTNLYNSENNAAGNGYSDCSFDFEVEK